MSNPSPFDGGRRVGGVLLHPTSLPGRFGIGDLGPSARTFVHWMERGAQGIWQVLPLGPTGYGDSPYQCFSAFAGNPLLISLEDLVDEGYLDRDDVAHPPAFDASAVDYGPVAEYKFSLLRQAYANFQAVATNQQLHALAEFEADSADWLEDYSLFMALKESLGGASWDTWEPAIAKREPAALDYWRSRLADETRRWRFWQFLFYQQWIRLRRYCHDRHIRIIGDMPIYVAHDSADVWSHPELFCLDAKGRPTKVAGVPPDYFSETGQLWGNPIYRWDALAATGFRWWIDRFRRALAVIDIVRLDHFRGFEAYWQVPASETTAIHGEWVPGPGAPLFEALTSALGPLPIIAENLGVITDEVEALRESLGFPGMAVLQFAWGGEGRALDYRPHNFKRRLLAYTGTHDNNTTVGWWKSDANGDSTRSSDEARREREYAARYLNFSGDAPHWAFIRALYASVAVAVIAPLQDVMGLGSETRMNLPGTSAGNWRWRFGDGQLESVHADRLREFAELYGRLPF